MSDRELLQEFKNTGSEEAFRELVERYAGLVFAVALRRTGNRSLSEEVAQSVFLILAAKARKLKTRGELASWLHRTTLLEASNAARKESVHQRKLEEFVEMSHNQPDPKWPQISPELDEAIDRLKDGDRSAVLLRFYEGMSFREVAGVLGKTEAAARQQVSRALSKLSGILRRKGITTSAAVLGSGMAAHLSAGTVPATTTMTIAHGAVAGAEGVSKISLLSHTINTMAYAKTKTAAAVAILAAIPIGLQWSENRKLRDDLENRSLGGAHVMGSQGEGETETFHGAGGLQRKASAPRQERKSTRAMGGVGAWQRALFEQDPVQRSQKLAELLATLDAQTAPGVAELFFGEGAEKGFESEARLFVRAWAQLDGERAVAFLEEKGKTKSANGAILAALGGWASNDPEAARLWAENAPDNVREDLLFGVIDGWALTDFNAAADYAETRPRSGARTRFIQLLLKRSMANGDIGGAQNWFAGISNDDHNRIYKRRAFEGIVSTMLYRDPAAAAQWIANQAGEQFVSPSSVNATARKLAESSPEDALRWLTSMPELEDSVSSRTHAGVLAQWASNEPERAGEWLRGNPNHVGYDEMARHYAAAVAGVDAEGAQRWAETIQDGGQREAAMVSIARQRMQRDGANADQLLADGFSQAQVDAAQVNRMRTRWLSSEVSGASVVMEGAADNFVRLWNPESGVAFTNNGEGMFHAVDADGDSSFDFYYTNPVEAQADLLAVESAYERATLEQMELNIDAAGRTWTTSALNSTPS